MLGCNLAVINTVGNEIKLDLSYFSKGVYLLEINANQQFAFRKFIIQ